MKAHSRDDANDLTHHVALIVVAGIDRDAFTNRILAGKILVDHCLIDDYNARRLFSVAFVEQASAQEHRFEC